MLPEALVGDVKLRLHVVVSLLREPDAARLGQLLQPRRDVDALAVPVLALDDDIAEVDADPHVDAAVLAHPVVALGHPALQVDGARHRVDDAAELGQKAVAHQLEDAAVVLLDRRLEQLPAVRSEPLKRAGFVLLHEAAVADDVGGENGGEPAFYGQSLQPSREGLWTRG